MQKQVSIIVPFHGETEAQLGICLSSINNQIGIDFKQVEVILIGDGGLKVDDQDPFPYLANLDIKIYEYDVVKGPGFARSMGMFMATGKYFMFVDADDQLHYVGALLDFFNAIKHGDHQVIIGRYINQIRNDQGDFKYYTHGYNDWNVAYAKWFNRDYLDSIKLSWSERLQVHEDTYFVSTACELATDIATFNPIVYTHLWNEHSITHEDDGQKVHRQLDQWVFAKRLYLARLRSTGQRTLRPITWTTWPTFTCGIKHPHRSTLKPSGRNTTSYSLNLPISGNKSKIICQMPSMHGFRAISAIVPSPPRAWVNLSSHKMLYYKNMPPRYDR
ncbi:glycosyltransferase family 2 protein [Lacticaseibacillus pantheris]|uniref:glycosyltransferase family 2 protein n=1 Tax=Lacticaseibacillus pantheris TaxID=171523 RepID=UPI0006CFF93C|nr:glycosyltransferase [Lacticaseibacillus pantheris]